MVRIEKGPLLYARGALTAAAPGADAQAARARTIAYGILAAHNDSGDMRHLRVKFDAMASHDITYVGIVQTARASGMREFPLPYVLTNCHNSLCAVGGTINEDDHIFGLSAARKYGGAYVPAHLAVIHQYMRECMAGCGRMLLGSDSHTRYGALGTMGIGEGGPELVKQLLGKRYEIEYPPVVAVHLTGAPRRGVGPQDVALALIRAVYANDFAKNKVLEFIGPGVGALSVEYRHGIDVMTTETACLSSVWETDEAVRAALALHGRPEEYRKLSPGEGACYDGAVFIDLAEIVPMIALPFHPSNAYPIAEFRENAGDLLRAVEKEARGMFEKPVELNLTDKARGGKVYVDQGVIAGCSGGMYENICEAASILSGKGTGEGGFWLSVYPSSQPLYLSLLRAGAAETLMRAGVTLRTAFCGPCFGAGDVPQNGGLSIRHTTRNFQSREGAKPGGGQMAYVALMDARSIAATAANAGELTAATDIEYEPAIPAYAFDGGIYARRVYQGIGRPDDSAELVFGPNIADWPPQPALPENLLLRVAASLSDAVTTTDELIPSGETSSYRSNPVKLAEFTLSRKDPGYVGRAKQAASLAARLRELRAGEPLPEELAAELAHTGRAPEDAARDTGLGSLIFARKPGDGSAREQAASCQRVLGGCANVAVEYATKRYRSNLINWGMLPLTWPEAAADALLVGDRVYLRGVREAIARGDTEISARRIRGDEKLDMTLSLPALTAEEREILLAGCLINHYAVKA